MLPAPKSYVDDSPDCAICFEPLHCSETITLKCGHRWHLDCIKEQLAHAQPSKTSRLLFSGCKCAKCNVFCDHPALEHFTRRTDILRKKVDVLLVEQLKIDSSEEWKSVQCDNGLKTAMLDSARRSYAFYLCGACEEPYFGGTINCADQEDGETYLPEQRLCGACSPKSVAVCDQTVEHRAFHIWKCRYCCRPSTFVCYGNVHFCDMCHERNSERDERKKRGEVTAPLEAIPCPGENCEYPKKKECNRHRNGKSFDCEQVYYCLCCRANARNDCEEERPGSRNFIVNPNGANQFRGWVLQHMPWKVEPIQVPIDNNTTTNFVSSFQWCSMYQTVPLHRYVNDPSAVRIEASAKFMGRTDCPSVFRLEILATDVRQRILRRMNSGILNSPVDFWEKISLVLEPMEGLHEVTLCISGRDSRFWSGNYGSKVCHCSVRVLGTGEELESLLNEG